MELQTHLSLAQLPSIQRTRKSRFKTGVQVTPVQHVQQVQPFRSKSLVERILDDSLEIHLLKQRIFTQRHLLNI